MRSPDGTLRNPETLQARQLSAYHRDVVAYRRNFLPGGTFFFTATLHDRRKDFLTGYVAVLREAFRYARRARPLEIDAIVILPDHLHCIWTLPRGDADYSHRWRLIKSKHASLTSLSG